MLTRCKSVHLFTCSCYPQGLQQNVQIHATSKPTQTFRSHSEERSGEWNCIMQKSTCQPSHVSVLCFIAMG